MALAPAAHRSVGVGFLLGYNERDSFVRAFSGDMMTKYKETARGGLAVNIIEC